MRPCAGQGLGAGVCWASSLGPSLYTHWHRPGAPWDEALVARSLEAPSAGEALSTIDGVLSPTKSL